MSSASDTNRIGIGRAAPTTGLSRDGRYVCAHTGMDGMDCNRTGICEMDCHCLGWTPDGMDFSTIGMRWTI